MKKFLSLVLALVMTMSLVTVAGASFTDADDVNYDAAVDVISELGIVGGYADGSFNPDGTLTRQAAAKIICNIAVGPEAAADLAAVSAPFADVAANNQFAGYIAYCVNEGIISGYADGTFKPANTLTGYAFLKMLLTTLGYDQNVEGYVGSNAQVNILLGAKDVRDADGEVASLLAGFDGKFNGSKAITREEACLLALNALQTKTVKYKENGSNITIGDVQISTGKGDMAYSDLLAEANFDMEKKDAGKDAEDVLGRPAYTWYVDGEKVGTYAKTATLVLTNEMDKDDIDEAIEDADLTVKKGVNVYVTENGATVELFANDDDEIEKAIVVKAYLEKAAKLDKDSKKTEYDDRAVKFNRAWVVADEEENKKGVEIANFEAVYEAAEDEESFLVTYGKNSKDEAVVLSVEIVEPIEATISRVKDDTITAGGEKYTVAEDYAGDLKTTKDDAKLWIGANGCVYDIDYTGAGSDEETVIYVDYVAKDEDKWGDPIYTAQVVNEKFEIAEITVAEKYAQGYYTVEDIDDGEYTLEAIDEEKEMTSITIEEDDTYVKVGGKKVYFAEDMVVVYINDTKADLAVTVKEGAQDVTAAYYELNDDDEIAVLYTKAEIVDESDEVFFIADAKSVGTERDGDGEEQFVYTVYADGEDTEVMIEGEVKTGFWTYTYDEETNVYELKSAKGYGKLVYGTDVEITKDKFVSYAAAKIDDVTVNNIYDLTDEGVYTLGDIVDWAEEEGETVLLSFIYDDDAEEITDLYVEFK